MSLVQLNLVEFILVARESARAGVSVDFSLVASGVFWSSSLHLVFVVSLVWFSRVHSSLDSFHLLHFSLDSFHLLQFSLLVVSLASVKQSDLG